jgi:predicted dehydrogenase
MRKVGIGLIGGGMIAKAHARALHALPLYSRLGVEPDLAVVAEASKELADKAQRELGFRNGTADWRELVEAKEVEVVAVATPNIMHKEMVLAALSQGKHVLCEKPLGLNGGEAYAMYKAARDARLTNMVAFGYRRVPAVEFCKQLLSSGSLGKPLAFRAKYFGDGNSDPKRPIAWRHKRELAGAGILGDIGSHLIDMSRYLMGEVASVSSQLRTWTPLRPSANGQGDEVVTVDDECALQLEFDTGALGQATASDNAPGRRNHLAFEINAERGSVLFDYERMNELQLYRVGDEASEQGFKTIRIGSPHPHGEMFYPNSAFGIGFTELHVIEWFEFMRGMLEGARVAPDFYDGYAVNAVIDAALIAEKCRVDVELLPR